MFLIAASFLKALQHGGYYIEKMEINISFKVKVS